MKTSCCRLKPLRSCTTNMRLKCRLSTITVKAADKIFVLKDGRVVQEGTHAELLADNTQENNYKKMWDEYRKSVTWKVGGAV